MALRLTGVGSYSTVYVDSDGNEQRIRVFHGQDVAALGLPEETLERLKKLTVRRAGRNVPYFTEDAPAAEPETKVEVPEPEQETTGAITAFKLGQDRAKSNAMHAKKDVPAEPEAETKTEEVEEKAEEAVVEEKPKKKAAPKKKATTKKTTSKKKPAPKKKTEE